MAKLRAEPGTLERPARLATFLPEAPDFPGGASFGRPASSSPMAGKSRPAGCAEKANQSAAVG